MEFVTLMTTQLNTGEEEYEGELVSNCCGANTTEPCRDNSAFCLDCKEHCEAVPVNDEPSFDERLWPPTRLTRW